MEHTSSCQRKPLSAAIALALCCLSGGVAAAPITYGNITLDATYSLGAGGIQDGMTDPNTSIFSNANGADMFLSTGDANGSVFFHTYGFTGTPTYFGARASGEGVFTAFTRATYSNTFTNTLGVAAPFIFSFLVDQGEVGFTGGGNGSAEMILRLKVNGTDVARDKTTININNGATTCAEDDRGTLGAYMGCATSDAAQGSGGNSQTFSINVGTFQPNESFTLDYDIIASVSGSLTSGSAGCDTGYGDNGYAELGDIAFTAFNGEGPGCGGYGVSRSGDPFGGPNGFDQFGNPISGFPGSLQGQFRQAQIPEPNALALLGIAGLAAGAASLRKRRRKES